MRDVIGEMVPQGTHWACAVEQIVKGPVRATVVDVLVDHPTLEQDAIVQAIRVGMSELGIAKLYVSESIPSRIVTDRIHDASGDLIVQGAEMLQPRMRLERVGIGAHRDDKAWPVVARLWLGNPL